MTVVRRQIRLWIAAWCVVGIVLGQTAFLADSVSVAQGAPTFYLPWESGSVWRITSDNDGGNHADQWNEFAFDAVPDEGRSTNHVTAIAEGTVLGFQNDIPNSALFYSGHAGNCMMIQHSDGTVSLYAHLATGSIPGELLSVGAPVQGGMVIGTVGNTGYADGVHLHWSLASSGSMYEGEGYSTCLGASIPSQYADNDAELIEDGGVPRTGRYYASTNGGSVIDQPINDPPMITAIGYDRNAAVDTAVALLDGQNDPDNGSASYVSNVLWGGGLPQTDDWQGDAVANANELVNYLVSAHQVDDTKSIQPGEQIQLSWSDNNASDAELGDVIAYDWEGDGYIDHVAVVTNINGDGFPEVSEHSPMRLNRYWTYSEADQANIEAVYPSSVAYLIRIVPLTLPNF